MIQRNLTASTYLKQCIRFTHTSKKSTFNSQVLRNYPRNSMLCLADRSKVDSSISIQLNFVKANFIKTIYSVRRSKISVPNRVLLILTKFSWLRRSIYVELFMCRSIFCGPEVEFSS